jgi:hypothetical protein
MPANQPPPLPPDVERKWTALSLRRSPRTELIPASEIDAGTGWEPDPQFTKMYCEYMEGKRTVYATRMPLSALKCGFYRTARGGALEFHCDKPEPEDIGMVVHSIREGYRLPIFIYRNPNRADAEPYVAPDDVAVFRAYDLLEIRKVPVVSLTRPKANSGEGAYEIRTFRKPGGRTPAYVVGFQPGLCDKVPAFVHCDSPEAAIQSLQELRRRIAEAQTAVKRFHVAGKTELHYHHTLYSTLYRLDETLHAVILLLERNMWHQAVPSLRLLYETALNFYVDWLAPEQMAPFLALAAVLDNEGVRNFARTVSTIRPPGASTSVDRSIEKAIAGIFELVRNVRLKAELCPLGLRFYDNIYSFMSGMTHQDFQTVANFARTFHQPERPQLARDTIMSLLLAADVIVAMVVLRVQDDVGTIASPAEGHASVDS